MMPKYINADEAKFKIKRTCLEHVLDEEIENDLINAINEVQAEDVKKNEHGKWILILQYYVAADGFTHRLYECDKCGRQIVGAEENYCPNCGASMRER